MRVLVLALALLSLSCSRPEQAAKREEAPTAGAPGSGSRPTQATVSADGDPYGLRFQGAMLTFCDKRGARKLDLATGQESASDQACPKNDEANTACSGLPVDVSVRSPASEPNDIIDYGAQSFPLQGHVHDCAADGKTLAVATGSSVLLVDLAKNITTPVSHDGGDRVAIGPGWVAWAAGSKISAAFRSASK